MPRLAYIAAASALAMLTAAPVSAWAATAEVVEPPLGSEAPTRVSYRASPGELNRVEVTVSEHHVVIEDLGAALTAGSGCEQRGPSRVQCPRRLALGISLGDADDIIGLAYRGEESVRPRFDDFVASVDAGPGNDRVRGGRGPELVDGGGGRDVLLGGGGDDLLGDGDFNHYDPVDRRTPDADLLDGGDGSDQVRYFGRSQPVTVRLESARGGQAGEEDAIRRIEDVAGGSGDDVLVGDEARNRLDGGDSGNDRLYGNAGNDSLSGGHASEDGSAVDRLFGGSGNDRLQTLAHRGAVHCGTGHDVVEVFPLARRAVLRADCERIHGFPPIAVRPSLDRLLRRATYRLPCRQVAGPHECRARVVLRDTRGRLLARGTGQITSPRHTTRRAGHYWRAVTVRLNSRARRELRRRGRMTVQARITIDVRGRSDWHSSGEWQYTFVLPAR